MAARVGMGMTTPPRLCNDPHTLRMMVLGALRLGGVVLVAWGLAQVGNRLMYGLLGPSGLRGAWLTWQGIGETHGLFRGVPVLLVGVTLCASSRWLARWIVAAPEQGCPRCGHDTSGRSGDRGGSAPARCAECGYHIA